MIIIWLIQSDLESLEELHDEITNKGAKPDVSRWKSPVSSTGCRRQKTQLTLYTWSLLFWGISLLTDLHLSFLLHHDLLHYSHLFSTSAVREYSLSVWICLDVFVVRVLDCRTTSRQFQWHQIKTGSPNNRSTHMRAINQYSPSLHGSTFLSVNWRDPPPHTTLSAWLHSPAAELVDRWVPPDPGSHAHQWARVHMGPVSGRLCSPDFFFLEAQ